MPQRKVLMLASTSDDGPVVPIEGSYTIEVEGGTLDDICVIEEFGFLRVKRIHGTNPISVYANCDD